MKILIIRNYPSYMDVEKCIFRSVSNGGGSLATYYSTKLYKG